VIIASVVAVIFCSLILLDKIFKNLDNDNTTDNIEDLEISDLNLTDEDTVISDKDHFEHLKKKLDGMPIDNQVFELENFIRERKNKAPHEAVELLIELKKKLRVAGNEKKLKAFEDRVQRMRVFADEIKEGDFSKISEVQRRLKNVDKMLGLIHSKEYLADNKSFDRELRHIKDILQGYCNGYEKLQADKRRAEQDAKQQLIDAARAVDGYYAVLASYLKNKDLTRFKTSLKSWIESRKELPEDYRERGIFFLNVLGDFKSIYDLIFKNSKILIGKKLPPLICPERYRGFKVKKVSKVGIVFASSKGKVVIEKKLKWSKLGTKRIIALISELYLTGESGITNETFNFFMIYTLLKQPGLIEEMSDKIKYPDKKSASIWEGLASDFKNAEREYTASQHFSKLVNMFENEDIAHATEYYHELKREIASTEFEKRHLPEIKALSASLFSLSPEIMAEKAVEKFAHIAPSAENTSGVLVAQSRYWNIINDKEREKLNSFKSACLLKLLSRQSLTEKYHCAPFYKWSREADGCALAYFKFLDKSGIFSNRQNIRSAFELAASLQVGDWNSVKKLFSSFSLNTASKILKNDKHAQWGVSIAFAYGVVAYRFGKPKKAFDALKFIKQALNNKISPESKVLYTMAAMELAMILGRNNIALDIGKQYKYKAGPLMDLETKLVMLSFLALLESQEVNAKRIEDIYSHVLRKNMKLRSEHFDDRTWCDIALEILKGDISMRRLNELKQTNCKYKDIAVRVLLAAFARNFYQNGGSDENKISQILKIADDNVGNGFYASSSKAKLFLLKGALTDNVSDLRDVFIEAMKDDSVSGVYYYPEQLVFLNVCDFLDGLFDKEKTIHNIEQYCAASLLAPDAFTHLSKILFDEKKSKIIGRMVKDGAYFQGFVCVILGKMLYYKDNVAVSGGLNDIYRRNETHYSWSEKMFMRNLNKIIEKSQ
jgi:hypothetical protein